MYCVLVVHYVHLGSASTQGFAGYLDFLNFVVFSPMRICVAYNIAQLVTVTYRTLTHHPALHCIQVGWTPLMIACDQGHTQVAMQLVGASNIDLDIKSNVSV